MLLIKILKSGKIINCEKNSINFLEENKNINKLNVWKYNTYDLILYGCIDGTAGKENKFDLPPPVDCELYFDDLYFVKFNDKNIIEDFTINEFNEFYNECFGGFEDIENTETSDEEELSEHTSDREFINDSDISIHSNTIDLDLSPISSFSDNVTSEDNTEIQNIIISDEQSISDISDISGISITCSSIDDDEIDTDSEDIDILKIIEKKENEENEEKQEKEDKQEKE
jgi:hypothetical protein